MSPGVGRRAGRRRPLRIDLRRAAREIRGGEELAERRLQEARIATPPLPVGEGELLGLDERVDQVSGEWAHLAEVEVLDDAELLEQHPAHRVRRRFADRVAPIAELDRRLRFRLERGEVAGRDQAARRLAPRGQGPREVAPVEVVGSGLGEPREALGEVRLDDRGADVGREAVAEEHSRAALIGAESADLLAGEVPVGPGRAEPLARVVDRGLEERGPRPPAETGVHRAPGADGARDRGGQRPRRGDAGRVPLRSGRARRGAGPVDDDRLAGPPQVDVVEAVAPEPRHERLDDGERRRDRHRRVDGVAAGLEREEPRLGGEGMVGGDGAPPPDDQRSVGPGSFVRHGRPPGVTPAAARRSDERRRSGRRSDQIATVQPRVSGTRAYWMSTIASYSFCVSSPVFPLPMTRRSPL